MKIMKTVVMLLIVAVLAAYVYLYEIKGGEEREKAKELSEKILNFEPDSVQTVEIRSLMGMYRFERQGGLWRIARPVKTGGDKNTIDGLLTTLSNMKKEREFSIRQKDKPQYGLVGRSTLAILVMKDGSRDSVRFGDETPVGSNERLIYSGNRPLSRNSALAISRIIKHQKRTKWFIPKGRLTTRRCPKAYNSILPVRLSIRLNRFSDLPNAI